MYSRAIRHIKALSFACILILTLQGCAVFHIKPPTEATFALPLASPLGPTRHIVQNIVAQWPGQQQSLLCVLELDSQQIAMAGLTQEGLSLFNLRYDGKTLLLDKSPLLPENVAPQLIISDLQLAYWPVAELDKILPSDWRLENQGNRRRLWHKQQLVTEISYTSGAGEWPQKVELINKLHHYRLHITTLSYDTLSE